MPYKDITLIGKVQIRHSLRYSDTHESVVRKIDGRGSELDGSVLEQLSNRRLHVVRGEGVILKRTPSGGASTSISASDIWANLKEVALAGVQDAKGTDGEWLSTSSTKLAIYHDDLMNRDIGMRGPQFVDVRFGTVGRY